MKKVAQTRGRRGDPRERTRPPTTKDGELWIDDSDRYAIEELIGVRTTSAPGDKAVAWKERRELLHARAPHVRRMQDVIARAVDLARRIDDACPDDGIEWDDLTRDAERLHAAAFGAKDEHTVARMQVMDAVLTGAHHVRRANLRRLVAREMRRATFSKDEAKGRKSLELSRSEQKRLAELDPSERAKIEREIYMYGGPVKVDTNIHLEKMTTMATEGAEHAIAKKHPHLKGALSQTLDMLRETIGAYAAIRNPSKRSREETAVGWLESIGLGCDARTLKVNMSEWRDKGRSDSR